MAVSADIRGHARHDHEDHSQADQKAVWGERQKVYQRR